MFLPYLRKIIILKNLINKIWKYSQWINSFSKPVVFKKIFNDFSSVWKFDTLLTSFPEWLWFEFEKTTISENVSVKLQLFESLFIRKILLNILITIHCHSFLKIRSPILGPILLQELWFDQVWIFTLWGCFHMSYSFLAELFFRKIFFKDFLIMFLRMHLIRYCRLTKLPELMILINLNLHNLRILPHKLQLFWP